MTHLITPETVATWRCESPARWRSAKLCPVSHPIAHGSPPAAPTPYALLQWTQRKHWILHLTRLKQTTGTCKNQLQCHCDKTTVKEIPTQSTITHKVQKQRSQTEIFQIADKDGWIDGEWKRERDRKSAGSGPTVHRKRNRKRMNEQSIKWRKLLLLLFLLWFCFSASSTDLTSATAGLAFKSTA